MIKIAILDDNKYYVDDVKGLLTEFVRYEDFTVYEYSEPESFFADLEKTSFDIVFLDIVLDDYDGIQIGLEINRKCPAANIIFISAYPEYFKDVYKVNHSYFLIKEFEKERFCDAVTKAIENVKNNYIVINTKNSVHKVILNEVVYFEGYLKHTILHMVDGTQKEYSIDLRKIEAQLSQKTFLRIHQGFVVNMNHIKNYSRQNVTVTGDKQIPISRSYLNSVREKITFFLGGAL